MLKQISITLILGASLIAPSLSARTSEYVQSKIDGLRFYAELSYLLNLGVCFCSSAVALGELLAIESGAKGYGPAATLLALWTGFKSYCGSYTITTLTDIEAALDADSNLETYEEEYYYSRITTNNS